MKKKITIGSRHNIVKMLKVRSQDRMYWSAGLAQAPRVCNLGQHACVHGNSEENSKWRTSSKRRPSSSPHSRLTHTQTKPVARTQIDTLLKWKPFMQYITLPDMIIHTSFAKVLHLRWWYTHTAETAFTYTRSPWIYKLWDVWYRGISLVFLGYIW